MSDPVDLINASIFDWAENGVGTTYASYIKRLYPQYSLARDSIFLKGDKYTFVFYFKSIINDTRHSGHRIKIYEAPTTDDMNNGTNFKIKIIMDITDE